MPVKPHPTDPNKVVYISRKYDLQKPRKWVPLTQEDLFELAPIWFERETSLIDFVALVDAKLKEKNHD